MNASLEVPVQRYLEALELELKQVPGVSPEDALSNAREFLQNNHESLTRAEPGLSDDDVYAHFVEAFGKPQDVAAGFADSSEPIAQRILGYAPGWRICCTKCGRSAPAGKAGITRIGTVSHHKYTLGYCRECRWIRWLRIIKDERRANLTRLLGSDKTPDEVRRSMHRPWRIILLILALALPLSVLPAFLPKNDPLPNVFQNLPNGWTVRKSFAVPAGQRDAIAQRLGRTLDLFVTLCRASHVPCRQVLGWLYGSEGHVWAEVLIEGEGWKPVDPTAGAGCGSDYVPLVTTEDGEIPLLYVSKVQIDIAATSDG